METAQTLYDYCHTQAKSWFRKEKTFDKMPGFPGKAGLVARARKQTTYWLSRCAHYEAQGATPK